LARHDLLQERIRDMLQRILPYERPRLSAIEVSGDQLNPTRVKPDLTKLTDEELDQLEKIVLKGSARVVPAHCPPWPGPSLGASNRSRRAIP
jgi:hypothetical protein